MKIIRGLITAPPSLLFWGKLYGAALPKVALCQVLIVNRQSTLSLSSSSGSGCRLGDLTIGD